MNDDDVRVFPRTDLQSSSPHRTDPWQRNHRTKMASYLEHVSLMNEQVFW